MKIYMVSLLHRATINKILFSILTGLDCVSFLSFRLAIKCNVSCDCSFLLWSLRKMREPWRAISTTWRKKWWRQNQIWRLSVSACGGQCQLDRVQSVHRPSMWFLHSSLHLNWNLRYRGTCLSVCLFVQSFSQPSLTWFRSNLDICYMSGFSCVL